MVVLTGTRGLTNPQEWGDRSPCYDPSVVEQSTGPAVVRQGREPDCDRCALSGVWVPLNVLRSVATYPGQALLTSTSSRPARSSIRRAAARHARIVRHVEGDSERRDPRRGQLRDGLLPALVILRAYAYADATAQRAEPGRDGVSNSLVRASDQRDRLFAHAIKHECGPAGRQHRLSTTAISKG